MRPYRALAHDPGSSYDVVVIGAGIGGLICAGLVAQAGKKVLLVEQHYMVGGYCSTFRRGPYIFDAATHFYPLLGNPATMTGSVLNSLGSRTRWVKMDPVDHFHFPDGSSFSVSADFNEYIDALKEAFPHEAKAIDRFFAIARDAYVYGLLYYFRGRRHGRLDSMISLSLESVLAREFKDPKLRLLLSADCAHWGSRPSTTSFVFDSMLRLSYFLGNYYPEGGSQVFADDLARIVQDAGGDILLRASADRIVVENGKAVAVEIATGLGAARHTVRVAAGAVVSNADLTLTYEKLLGPEVVGPAAIANLRQLKPTMPCFLTHLGLKGVSAEQLEPHTGYHWRSWNADDVALDAFKIFVPTIYEPKMAPDGEQILILQRIMEINYDNIRDWTAHKQRVEDDLLTRVEALIPGLSTKVVSRQSASAFTSYRFTLNTQGAMLGWEMAPGQLGESRPAMTGRVKNLHFCGHWTRPGGGITPVIVSAVDVARQITS
jgi:phytoene desaturase